MSLCSIITLHGCLLLANIEGMTENQFGYTLGQLFSNYLKLIEITKESEECYAQLMLLRRLRQEQHEIILDYVYVAKKINDEAAVKTLHEQWAIAEEKNREEFRKALSDYVKVLIKAKGVIVMMHVLATEIVAQLSKEKEAAKDKAAAEQLKEWIDAFQATADWATRAYKYVDSLITLYESYTTI